MYNMRYETCSRIPDKRINVIRYIFRLSNYMNFKIAVFKLKNHNAYLSNDFQSLSKQRANV